VLFERCGVNNEILESLIDMGDRLWKAAFEDEAALPFAGDYRINISWDAGSASFTINQGLFPCLTVISPANTMNPKPPVDASSTITWG
jgi:hypothetical protein